MRSEKDSARTTLLLAAATILIGGYAVLFGLQTMIFFEAHHWASGAPFLDSVPQPLPTTEASPVEERNISFYGFEFEAPWKGIAEKSDNGAQARTEFRSGPIIVFFNPADQVDAMTAMRSGSAQRYLNYAAVFGSQIFATNYDLFAAVYGASPNAVSPFMSRDTAIRMNALLTWKLAFGTNGAMNLYAIQSGDLRGFELGDPARDRFVVVRLFDPHDRQIELIFTSKSNQPGSISQADINCVVYSLKPVPLPE